MENIMVTDMCGHYEVRLFGDYLCTADTYAEAMSEALAYVEGGEL